MKNASLIVKLFTAITLFLIIPLIITGFVFNYNMISYSEQEISKSVITNLKTIKNMNDVLVEAISRDTIRLSLNTALDEMKGIKDYRSVKGNVENVIKLARVQSILRETYNSNHRLHSIYVYLEDADYIITSGEEGAVLKSEFRDTAWIKAYNEKKEDSTGTIWINSRLVNDGQNNSSPVNVITYLLPLKNLSLQLSGAIVVNIREDELSKLINSTEYTNSGYVFIIDNQGNVISHIDKSLVCSNIYSRPYIPQIIESKESSGYILHTIDKKKQIVSYNKTEFNGWTYVGVFSLDDLMDKANTLRTRIAFMLAMIIILGVIMSYLISRKLYSPLNALIQNVKKRKGIDLKGDENEMALLSRAFATIERREEDLQEMLEKNKKTIEEKFLINLLKGDEEEKVSPPSMVTAFPFKYYVCVIVSIDRFDKFIEKYPHDQQYYLKMLMLKVCEEIIGTSYRCQGVLFDTNKMVLIVNSDDENEEPVINTLKKHLQQAQEEISKVLDNKITMAVGAYHADKTGIPASFGEALEALKQKMVHGPGKIILWKEASIEENKYFYPYTEEKHILNNLNLGLKEETLSAVRELVQEIRNRKYLSSDNILQVFIQLVGNTVKYLVDNNINLSDVFGNDYNIYQKLSTKETLEEIELWLVGFYSGILEYARKPKNGNKSHIDNVFDFIQANYMKDIDVTAIADHAGISYSYVRKIVKDKTGKTVVDYVNGLRIDEAKRLLRQTDMNIMEIALQVGYNNDQSFNRFFKKYEGVTPGEFRSIG